MVNFESKKKKIYNMVFDKLILNCCDQHDNSNIIFKDFTCVNLKTILFNLKYFTKVLTK